MSDKLELGDKIGEGNFRACYAVVDNPGLCVKRLKSDLGFFQRIQVLFLRRRMNYEELAIYQNLPEDLKPYFNPVIEATEDYIVAGRPIDYDGKHSKPVCEYGKVSNQGFWKEVEHIVSLLDKHELWFFDTFQIGTNIFVQKLSEDYWKPIIVDYKHIGWKAFPMQFNLFLDSEKRKKFYRSYRRFEAWFRA